MTRFLIFYFIAYGGAHLYFYRKVTLGLNLSLRSKLTFTFFLLLLFVSPLAARSLESSGFNKLPELLSNTGYLWMGLLFLFVSAAAALDGITLLLSFFSRKRIVCTCINPLRLLVIAASYTVIIGSYGFFEATNIKTEHISIMSSRIPLATGRIRIVQLSDVHVGQIVREQRVRAILECVKATSPDILVSTGDLVDGHQRHLNGLDQLFLEIAPRLGKYAILGNHEYYVGIDRSLKFMSDAGFKVLKNENQDIAGILCLTGVDDSRSKSQRAANALLEKDLLLRAGTGEFRLLLKHRPVVEKESVGMFDLQLSGHVHKGQIFPFNFLTWLSFPVKTGLTELEQGHYLYVSRGTGVWGPPIRFLAPPEVTVIDLIAAKGAKSKI